VIATHLPALQIVVPLIAAPICLLLRRENLTWAWATFISWVVFALAWMMLQQVLTGGPFNYELGGWEAPYGIEYRVDAVNAFILLIVAAIGAVVMPYARASVAREIPEHKRGLFYTAYLLCLTGLLGITITGDAFNVFVFLEISSLSSYALIALGRDPKALTAAFQYLVMGTIGATFILIGIGLMYQMTGTLNMADLAKRLPAVEDTRPVLAAFAFFIVGVCLKLALFPLHLWLPNAYAYAPSVVTAFLAATATKVSIYVLFRFVFTVFGQSFSFDVIPLESILLVLSLAGIFVASTVAIFQTNVKRLLAYSSVAQIGYIMLGVALVSVAGLTASILHIFNHAIMKGALFLCMGAVYYQIGSVKIEDMKGIGKKMPFTMFAFVIAGLGLIGVPLTVGFISKWYLITAVLEKGWWPVAVLILLSSLLAVIYIWRVVEAAYFKAGDDDDVVVKEAPMSMLIPIYVLTGASVYFGVETSLPLGTAAEAAKQLMGIGG
jgi:multicomponent Na+:H+ antiporter subunit D